MKLELEMNLDNAAFRDGTGTWTWSPWPGASTGRQTPSGAARPSAVLSDHGPEREPVRALFHI